MLDELPYPLWALIGGGIVLLTVLRVIFNALPGSRPPVFEGLPWIGGIQKFMKVVLTIELST